MGKLVVNPPELVRNGSSWRRQVRLERVGGGANRSIENTLWFEVVSDAVPPPPDHDVESFLLATLFLAMAEGRDLAVRGAASRTLLANLSEFRDAWNCWAPETYAAVEFEPDSIVEDEGSGAPTSAVVAVSGGVDSYFTTWRHASGAAGHQTRTISLGAMVHGFDIRRGHQGGFDRAFGTAAKVLETVSIPLAAVRTNLRAAVPVNWEHLHGAALAAALQQFKSVAGSALIGSTEPYDDLVMAWGSNPITDHLLSSSSFRIIHDGAAFSRPEKTAALAEWPRARESLRVCWEDDATGMNCGACEKCLRTMMTFAAIGADMPSSFPPVETMAEAIEHTRLKPSLVVLGEWDRAVKMATERGIEAPWIRAAQRKSARSWRALRWRRRKATLKSFLEKRGPSLFRDHWPAVKRMARRLDPRGI